MKVNNFSKNLKKGLLISAFVFGSLTGVNADEFSPVDNPDCELIYSQDVLKGGKMWTNLREERDIRENNRKERIELLERHLRNDFEIACPRGQSGSCKSHRYAKESPEVKREIKDLKYKIAFMNKKDPTRTFGREGEDFRIYACKNSEGQKRAVVWDAEENKECVFFDTFTRREYEREKKYNIFTCDKKRAMNSFCSVHIYSDIAWVDLDSYNDKRYPDRTIEEKKKMRTHNHSDFDCDPRPLLKKGEQYVFTKDEPLECEFINNWKEYNKCLLKVCAERKKINDKQKAWEAIHYKDSCKSPSRPDLPGCTFSYLDECSIETAMWD